MRFSIIITMEKFGFLLLALGVLGTSFAAPADDGTATGTGTGAGSPKNQTSCNPGRVEETATGVKICSKNGFWYSFTNYRASCEKGEFRYNDCNNCTCVDQKWNCTKYNCRDRKHNRFIRSTPDEKKERVCAMGESFKADCNTCFCMEDGNYGCTIMMCPPKNLLSPASSGIAAFSYTPQLRNEISLSPPGPTTERTVSVLPSTCEEGDRLKLDCNYCFCAGNNNWGCTLMGCDGFHHDHEGATRDRREAENVEVEGSCTPGEYFQADCNTCYCTESGQYACTLRGCIHDDIEQPKLPEDLIEKGAQFQIAYAAPIDPVPPGNDQKSVDVLPATCKEGDHAKLDCNFCFCTGDNNWGCTIMACPPYQDNTQIGLQSISYSLSNSITSDPFTALPSTCKEGDVHQLDCNTCVCSGNNLWGCTLMGCGFHNPLVRERRDAESKKEGDQCEGAEEVEETDTHLCFCLGDKWNCIEKGNDCQPEETTKIDCNSCFCSRTGHWACTLMACQSMIVPYSGDARSVVGPGAEEVCKNWDVNHNETTICSCYDNDWHCQEIECKQGEHKMDDCNHCFCAGHGLWACTRMGCVQDGVRNVHPKREADDSEIVAECADGDHKMEDCNDCHCANGRYACTRRLCSNDAIKINDQEKRSVDVPPYTSDLRNTPCAPYDDYFDVDCNRCYCNNEGSGYLCTVNSCMSTVDFSNATFPVASTALLLGISNGTVTPGAVTDLGMNGGASAGGNITNTNANANGDSESGVSDGGTDEKVADTEVTVTVTSASGDSVSSSPGIAETTTTTIRYCSSTTERDEESSSVNLNETAII